MEKILNIVKIVIYRLFNVISVRIFKMKDKWIKSKILNFNTCVKIVQYAHLINLIQSLVKIIKIMPNAVFVHLFSPDIIIGI